MLYICGVNNPKNDDKMIEKMMEILKKWFKKSSVATPENVSVETPETMEVKNKKHSLLDTLQEYLFTNYDFRFNVLTEQAEYAPKGKDHYQLADKRKKNTKRIPFAAM